MNEIVCIINLFQLDWPVLYNEKVVGHVSGNDIEDTLKYCASNNAERIHLFGNQEFCEELAKIIQESENTTYYDLKSIEIEVN